MENSSTPLPRITIRFCTQCKWMLRAAYFAQELLSTFGNSLGEVALQPSTGGTFIIHLYHASEDSALEDGAKAQQHLLWDRKAESGFPETKELKRRVRDIIDPTRDLGHVDGKKASTNPASEPQSQSQTPQPSSTTQTPPRTETTTPIPRAINRLQASELSGGSGSSSGNPGERNFTPMDIDVNSRPGSSGGGTHAEEEAAAAQAGGEKEAVVVNERGKIVIGGEGVGFCKPGEDCEDCG